MKGSEPNFESLDEPEAVYRGFVSAVLRVEAGYLGQIDLPGLWAQVVAEALETFRSGLPRFMNGLLSILSLLPSCFQGC